MPDKKEARQSWKSGRASVREHDRSISQEEWERGMRLLWIPFVLMLAAYVAWEAMAPCPW